MGSMNIERRVMSNEECNYMYMYPSCNVKAQFRCNAITIEINTILAYLSLFEHSPPSHCLRNSYKRTMHARGHLFIMR